ncbi:hypothetical protein AWB79_07509 [Caballeronia hypogeia]|uniref:Lipoprotein n=1 Tax=Caballeronia hypogeia TaxID=1777140 RepID=A0A158DT27_9BURK|nr:hypothetical protein [Caballeronia hypogeia]SAK97728.1 hypothetical protein AWB79_07509 [Caballeronia hypogeia]
MLYRKCSAILLFLVISKHVFAECEVGLDGSKVMELLEKTGTIPALQGASCSYIAESLSLSAGPAEDCVIVFRNDQLKDNWRLKKITGDGTFSNTISDDGVRVTISAGGGFKPSSFMLLNKSISDKECPKNSTAESLFK